MSSTKSIGFFEKYLTLWVLICIAVGIGIGSFAQSFVEQLNSYTIASINLPVAILVWLMIYPMMVQIDFSSLKNVFKAKKGIYMTVGINWLIKPFTMALIAYVFFQYIFAPLLSPTEINEFLAGAILLGAAPCTAMVFVWSYLTDGDPNYTLTQVAINDLILLVAFIPIVTGLFSIFDIEFFNASGQSIGIPYNTLILSVVLFVVLPLLAGYISNVLLIKKKGQAWFENEFLPRLKPISIIALLTTLVLIFALQGQQILNSPWTILLIAVPLILQTYLIFFSSWAIGRYLQLPHAVCAPATMIGASNFFELAVAVAIALFGLNSGATLTTVVGVLIEVPVMLSLVSIANKWKY